jgi:hypothetical protein
MSVAVASREDAVQPGLPFPVRPPAPQAAVTLLAQAQRGLAEARAEKDPAERFISAYLSALRAGAAVLAARGRPHRGRAKPASVWTLLESAAPELKEWALYFAGHSATQAAAQSGITRGLDEAAAEELVQRGGQFVELARHLVHGVG